MTSLNPVDPVAVVIVTYNGAPWIEACVQSVLASDQPVKIIVVDNCSIDNTRQILTQKFPGVRLIGNSVNAGFGAANNIGLAAALEAGARFFFLLNQDTTVEPQTISTLVKAFSTNRNGFGVLSPIHLNSTGDSYDSGFHNYLKKYLDTEDLQGAGKKPGQVTPIDFVNAAAWMIPKGTLETVGGFAPLFFHYGEDRDFVNRMKYFSLRLGIVGGVSIRHFRDDRAMDVSQWSFERRCKYYFVGGLTRATDINRSLVTAWVDGKVWMLKETLVQLVRLKLDAIIVLVKVAWRMFCHLRKIIRHRRDVRTNITFKFLQ
jgi:GT2 family glycosyltransferase